MFSSINRARVRSIQQSLPPRRAADGASAARSMKKPSGNVGKARTKRTACSLQLQGNMIVPSAEVMELGLALKEGGNE